MYLPLYHLYKRVSNPSTLAPGKVAGDNEVGAARAGRRDQLGVWAVVGADACLRGGRIRAIAHLPGQDAGHGHVQVAGQEDGQIQDVLVLEGGPGILLCAGGKGAAKMSENSLSEKLTISQSLSGAPSKR